MLLNRVEPYRSAVGGRRRKVGGAETGGGNGALGNNDILHVAADGVPPGILPDNDNLAVDAGGIHAIGCLGRGLIPRRGREGKRSPTDRAVRINELAINVRAAAVPITPILPDDKIDIFVGQVDGMRILLIFRQGSRVNTRAVRRHPAHEDFTAGKLGQTLLGSNNLRRIAGTPGTGSQHADHHDPDKCRQIPCDFHMITLVMTSDNPICFTLINVFSLRFLCVLCVFPVKMSSHLVAQVRFLLLIACPA